jgi:hypothetical protein
LQALFAELQRALPGRRRAALLATDEISTPIAAGFLRPAVLVPSFLVEQLSETEIAGVLAHELAHLRRGDDWMNLAQRLVEAVAFFHPAVLYIGRRLRLEREMACDDWVVALTGTPRPYARCLAKLAALAPAAGPELAPGAVARKPQISVRVEALLAKGRNGQARCSKAALALAGGALAFAGLLAAPLAPLSVAEPPVPALEARTTQPPVPSIAYAAPKPPVRRAAPEAPRMARLRKPAEPVFEQVSVRAWQAPDGSYYLVCVSGSEPGWVKVFWMRAVRASIVLGHA